jgi:hypothetical protein
LFRQKQGSQFCFHQVRESKTFGKNQMMLQHHLLKATFVTMKLQGAANNLNPNLARGHKNWNARFTAIPEGDKLKDNEQMREIFKLLLTATKKILSLPKKWRPVSTTRSPPFFLASTPSNWKTSSCFTTLNQSSLARQGWSGAWALEAHAQRFYPLAVPGS